MILTTHKNTDPHCGAVGPIAYAEGKAWSVNTIAGKPTDWRFELIYTHHRCMECRRHIELAKKEV